jgi:hypothetical protein
MEAQSQNLKGIFECDELFWHLNKQQQYIHSYYNNNKYLKNDNIFIRK